MKYPNPYINSSLIRYRPTSVASRLPRSVVMTMLKIIAGALILAINLKSAFESVPAKTPRLPKKKADQEDESDWYHRVD